jgi:hypothetical protein
MPRGARPPKTPPFTLTRLGLLQGNATAAFEPYQGALKPESSARKKDLRKLGEWIEAKRIAENARRQLWQLKVRRRRPINRSNPRATINFPSASCKPVGVRLPGWQRLAARNASPVKKINVIGTRSSQLGTIGLQFVVEGLFCGHRPGIPRAACNLRLGAHIP